MKISDWPKMERPREKLFKQGVGILSDAELLAVFLRTGAHGKTAVDLARELLNQFKGLNGLLSAGFSDFKQVKGLGLAKFCQLQAALELARRHWEEDVLTMDNPLDNPEQIYRYLQTHLYSPSQEIFACLFLNNQCGIIALEKLFYGTLTRAAIYPREVVRAALRHNAAAAVLVHNHPSGNTQPSPSDYEVTDLLSQALDVVEVHVLDHLIIGREPSKTVSLAEEGYFLGKLR